ncbi:unnamed protein product [Staphylococcus haemolyticus JCSC1435]|uniref:Uncharacterized protein n=1 Tax=Staphylococcus haemolyticus (strain JCSC1435) TaxID=279808 RepID=Q4L3G9_STAHJ|nr:unnamed protein product [Staphylococcus haemolyticus JCSC1435]
MKASYFIFLLNKCRISILKGKI